MFNPAWLGAARDRRRTSACSRRRAGRAAADTQRYPDGVQVSTPHRWHPVEAMPDAIADVFTELQVRANPNPK